MGSCCPPRRSRLAAALPIRLAPSCFGMLARDGRRRPLSMETGRGCTSIRGLCTTSNGRRVECLLGWHARMRLRRRAPWLPLGQAGRHSKHRDQHTLLSKDPPPPSPASPPSPSSSSFASFTPHIFLRGYESSTLLAPERARSILRARGLTINAT